MRVGGALHRDTGAVSRALRVLVVTLKLHVPHILICVLIIPRILHKIENIKFSLSGRITSTVVSKVMLT